jgi:chromosome partitioning protein
VLTIVIASQKGGAGKTTLCGHLAVEAEMRGNQTALLDTDPQGGLASWWNVRAAESPRFFRPAGGALRTTLDELRAAGYAYTIIDTPPAITDSIIASIAEADLVVVPTKPSPHDLRAVGATVDLVAAAGKPMVFVLTQAIQRARLTADALIALSEHGPIARPLVHHRLDYVSSMIDGRVAQEVNAKSEAAKEMRELWEFLTAYMAKGKKHVVAAG